MPLADLAQDRIDAAAAQAQRIAQQIPPLSDAVTVPIDVLQMIFAALFALLHRLGPQVVKAIILLNEITIRARHFGLPRTTLPRHPNLARLGIC